MAAAAAARPDAPGGADTADDDASPGMLEKHNVEARSEQEARMKEWRRRGREASKPAGRATAMFVKACAAGDVAVVKEALAASRARTPSALLEAVSSRHARGGAGGSSGTSSTGASPATPAESTATMWAALNVNAATREGFTPLYMAAACGHLDVVNALLADERVDVSAKVQPCRPWRAFRRRHLREGREYASEAEADSDSDESIDMRDTRVESPLYTVGDEHERPVCARDVLKWSKADIGMRVTCVRWSPRGPFVILDVFDWGYLVLNEASGRVLWIVFGQFRHMIDHVRIGLRVRVAIGTGNTALHAACLHGHVDVGRAILAHPQVEPDKPNAFGVSPLFMACAAGAKSRELVEQLLTTPRVSVMRVTNNNATVFIAATSSGDVPLVNRLRSDPRVDVSAANVNGSTALTLAAQLNLVDVLKVLLADTRIDTSVVRVDQCNLLSVAAFSCAEDAGELLIEDGRVELEAVDSRGWTTLAHCAHSGACRLLRALVSRGCDPTKRVVDGSTALYLAAHGGNAEVVRYLLSLPDVDPNAACDDGTTPLWCAAALGFADIVRLFVADPRVEVECARQDGITALNMASFFGRAEVVDLLLADPRVDPERGDDRGWTPFFSACGSGNIDTVRRLAADPRVKVDVVASSGATGLFFAAQNGGTEIVRFLLDSGKVDPLRPRDDGVTALSVAAHKDRVAIVKMIASDARVREAMAVFTPPSGWGPLAAAVQADAAATVKLLAEEFNVSLFGDLPPHSVSAACIAVISGATSVVRYLCSTELYNPVEFFKPARASTALTIAAMRGMEEIVRVLVDWSSAYIRAARESAAAAATEREERKRAEDEAAARGVAKSGVYWIRHRMQALVSRKATKDANAPETSDVEFCTSALRDAVISAAREKHISVTRLLLRNRIVVPTTQVLDELERCIAALDSVGSTEVEMDPALAEIFAAERRWLARRELLMSLATAPQHGGEAADTGGAAAEDGSMSIILQRLRSDRLLLAAVLSML